MSLSRSLTAFAIAAGLLQNGHSFQLQPAFRSVSSTSVLYSMKSNVDHTKRRRGNANNNHKVREVNTHSQQNVLKRDSETIFSLIDADGNGDVSLEELKEYLLHSDGPYTGAVVDSIFSRLDTDQNGSLSLEEFHQALQQHELFRSAPGIELQQSKKQQQQNSQKLHSTQKQQQGGVTSRDNVLKSTRSNTTKKGPSATLKKLYQEAKSYFQNIDTDKDGSISSKELKDYFVLKKMTQIAQTNGLLFAKTEQVAKRDFVLSESAIDNIFRLLDVNADGRISFSELRDAFVRYRAVRQAFRA